MENVHRCKRKGYTRRAPSITLEFFGFGDNPEDVLNPHGELLAQDFAGGDPKGSQIFSARGSGPVEKNDAFLWYGVPAPRCFLSLFSVFSPASS